VQIATAPTALGNFHRKTTKYVTLLNDTTTEKDFVQYIYIQTASRLLEVLKSRSESADGAAPEEEKKRFLTTDL
jgi:hypothetical protein